MNTFQNLETLGFDDWFDKQAKINCLDRSQLARVIAVDREQYLLLNETEVFRARLSGKFRHESHSPEELPCVGDWLYVEKNASDEYGIIHAVLKRKTFLRRKAAGQSSDYQMIAANVDVVFIVQSCHFDFNLKRLERYLVMVAEGNANPIILLTKTDLVASDELDEKIDLIRKAGITEPIQTLSNITKQGIDELNQLLSSGKTYCFVGSSGVGKSTVINGLLGEEKLATKNVSTTGEGTHTTVRRELIVLDSGVMVIDTPGMREFGILASDEAIESGFSDINQLAQECHFRDCTHTNEPGCAVLKAVNEGRIAYEHFENFKKLSKESEFNRMSYAEKRKKDKAFGKFVKNVKKDFYHN
jgi:ribosome biogenesis GTPase